MDIWKILVTRLARLIIRQIWICVLLNELLMKEEEGPGLPISVRHLTQHSRSMACHNNRPLTVSFIVWAAISSNTQPSLLKSRPRPNIIEIYLIGFIKASSDDSLDVWVEIKVSSHSSGGCFAITHRLHLFTTRAKRSCTHEMHSIICWY